LVINAILIITIEINKASFVLYSKLRFISIPTLIRKNGINNVLPTNSILFINAELFGIKRLNANPDKKAPIIGSIPANSAKKAEANTNASTKIYFVLPSL
jgi:hypothetical protein